jgi:hypothetical protein
MKRFSDQAPAFARLLNDQARFLGQHPDAVGRKMVGDRLGRLKQAGTPLAEGLAVHWPRCEEFIKKVSAL